MGLFNLPCSIMNQLGVNSSLDINLGVGVNNTDTGMDVDIKPDSAECGLNGTLLGDRPEGKDEGSDSESEDQDDELAVMTTDEMDVDGAPPDYEGHDPVPPFRAGCVWSRADYSCASNVVFMAFFALYSQSPASWRDEWRQRSPEWTAPLADSFDFLEALDVERVGV